MRSVRPHRRSFIDLRRVTIGDWIVLVASLLTLVSLFLPWFQTSTTGQQSQWAFTYSEVASVIVIVFFLATLILVIYPSLSSDVGLAPLPFSTPLVFFSMGSIMLLLFTYELGKYDNINSSPLASRGYGIWVGFIAALVYLIGAVIKWGSRPARRD